MFSAVEIDGGSSALLTLRKGRYATRAAERAEDIAAAMALRSLVFRQGDGADADADAFDAISTHVLVEDVASGTLVACFRLLLLPGGAEIGRSYSAQFYDLARLRAFDGPLLELGRFCIHPDWQDPDILRVAWAAMTGLVDGAGVGLLFGCSSFRGTDPMAFADAFALLRDRHLAPERWRPGVKAAEVFDFARALDQPPDQKRALAVMPPLLRTYLIMAGWVSDHAVIDRDLGTTHVFVGVEIAAVPPARARLLRGLAE